MTPVSTSSQALDATESAILAMFCVFFKNQNGKAWLAHKPWEATGTSRGTRAWVVVALALREV